MTSIRVCRGRLDDAERSALVFAGDLLVFPGVAGLDAFRDRVDELARARLGSADPEMAQFALSPDEYRAAVGELRREVRADPRARQRLLTALANTGMDLSATYWDWVYLRVLPHGSEHAAQGTGWHRDTWASNVAAQTNWWTPIYPLTSARTITFAPAKWDEPVPNTSDTWSPRQSTVIPEPLHAVSGVPEVRVVVEPGDLFCFSGAHLHGSVPNETGRARFSVEVRTVHAGDVGSGRGAPNVDGRAAVARHQWFRHVETDETLTASPA